MKASISTGTPSHTPLDIHTAGRSTCADSLPPMPTGPPVGSYTILCPAGTRPETSVAFTVFDAATGMRSPIAAMDIPSDTVCAATLRDEASPQRLSDLRTPQTPFAPLAPFPSSTAGCRECLSDSRWNFIENTSAPRPFQKDRRVWDVESGRRARSYSPSTSQFFSSDQDV